MHWTIIYQINIKQFCFPRYFLVKNYKVFQNGISKYKKEGSWRSEICANVDSPKIWAANDSGIITVLMVSVKFEDNFVINVLFSIPKFFVIYLFLEANKRRRLASRSTIQWLLHWRWGHWLEQSLLQKFRKTAQKKGIVLLTLTLPAEILAEIYA